MNAFHRIVQLWGSRITKINYQCPREILCSNWLPMPWSYGYRSKPQILGAPTARLCHSRGLPLLHDMIIHNVSCIKSLGSEAIRKGEMIQRGWFIPQSKGHICWSRILRKRFSEIIQRRISFVPQQFNIAEKDGQFPPVSIQFPPPHHFFCHWRWFCSPKKTSKVHPRSQKVDFCLISQGFSHRFSP